MRAVLNTLRIAALGLIATLPATAKAEEGCWLRNGYCVPFVGCFEDGSLHFVGRTHGRRDGPLIAETSEGAICTGTWKRTFVGAGKAVFSCDDGRKGRVLYTYFDEGTGTAVGKGATEDGDRLIFFSGRAVRQYMDNDGSFDPALAGCISDALDVPIS